MESIAPLAKVLAEANGIDWRRIAGSGDGGQIVETDILNYLQRVVSGDEEPPSTPVDPPPADWAGDLEQVDVAALGATGLGAEIAEFVQTARNEAAELAAGQSASTYPAAGPDLMADALEFELELDDDPHPQDRDPEEHPAQTRDPNERAQQPRDADYAGAEVIEHPEGPSAPITPGPLDPGMPVRPVGPLNEPVQGDGFTPPAQDTPPHRPADEMGLPSDSPTRRSDPNDGHPSIDTDEERSGWHDPTPDERQDMAALEETVVAPVTLETVEVAPVEHLEVAAVAEVAAPSVQSMTGSLLSNMYGGASTADTQPVPVAAPAFEAHVQEEAPAAQVEPEPAAQVEPQVVVPVVAAPQAAVPAAPAAARSTMRLSVDASGLQALSAQIGAHLGQNVPSAVLVARAAARSAHLLGVSGVGVYGQGEAPIATPNLGGDFRAALGDITSAAPGNAAALMVIDAAELGLDELDLGVGTSVSLGRTVAGRATLSLSGAPSARSGAAFLQAVAAQLEQPSTLLI